MTAAATLADGTERSQLGRRLSRRDHRAEVITNTKAGVAVKVFGWASSSAIGAFGLLATALMMAIYLHVRLRRLTKRSG